MYDRDRCETLDEKAFEAFVACELTAQNSEAVHALLKEVGQVKLPIVSHSQRAQLRWSQGDRHIEVVIIDGCIDSWWFTDAHETLSDEWYNRETLVGLIREHIAIGT